MLEKHMKSVLSRKITQWLASIDDEEVRRLACRDVIVSGGCFTSFIQGEQPNDYDLYFATMEATVAVAKYYIRKFYGVDKDHEARMQVWHLNTVQEIRREQSREYELWCSLRAKADNDAPVDFKSTGETFKSEEDYRDFMAFWQELDDLPPERVYIYIPSSGVASSSPDDFGTPDDEEEVVQWEKAEATKTIPTKKAKDEEKPYRPVFFTSNAITLTDGIQLVTRFYGDPKQIHDNYDFVHTKAYWWHSKHELSVPKEVYEAVANKVLIYTGSKYPVCSMFRVRKFLKRGWTVNAGQLLKIAIQISDLDLDNFHVLKDQLIGVDFAYFQNLLYLLREKDGKFQFDRRIDRTYFLQLIDKIF